MFYNTNKLAGQELKEAVLAAKKQDEILERLILTWPGEFTPSDLWAHLHREGHYYLLTSVRRSLDALKGSGFIEETGDNRLSPFKGKERILKMKAGQLKLF